MVRERQKKPKKNQGAGRPTSKFTLRAAKLEISALHKKIREFEIEALSRDPRLDRLDDCTSSELLALIRPPELRLAVIKRFIVRRDERAEELRRLTARQLKIWRECENKRALEERRAPISEAILDLEDPPDAELGKVHRKERGEHLVRVVRDLFFAPSKENSKRLQEAWGVKFKKNGKPNGHWPWKKHGMYVEFCSDSQTAGEINAKLTDARDRIKEGKRNYNEFERIADLLGLALRKKPYEDRYVLQAFIGKSESSYTPVGDFKIHTQEGELKDGRREHSVVSADLGEFFDSENVKVPRFVIANKTEDKRWLAAFYRSANWPQD
jgi:hypothetical protein